MTKIFRDLTRKFVGLNIKKSVLTTKMRVFDHKNMYLTMKLEPVLTTKIVDNFVRFGMPYENLASFPGSLFAALVSKAARQNPEQRAWERG